MISVAKLGTFSLLVLCTLFYLAGCSEEIFGFILNLFMDRSCMIGSGLRRSCRLAQ